MSRREIPKAPANGAPGPVFGSAPAEVSVSVTLGELLDGGLTSSVFSVSDGLALELDGVAVPVVSDSDTSGLDDTGALELTGALEDTGALELTGALEDTGGLEDTGALDDTGGLEDTGALDDTGGLDDTRVGTLQPFS